MPTDSAVARLLDNAQNAAQFLRVDPTTSTVTMKDAQLVVKGTNVGDTIATLTSQVSALMAANTALMSRVAALEQNKPTVSVEHWGVATCPTPSTLIYSGYMVGGHYTHHGIYNYFCLASTGNVGNRQKAAPDANRAILYQIEWETVNGPFTANNDMEAECSVCEIPDATQTLMIPARDVCPTGYKKLYSGWLMAQQYQQSGKMAVWCAPLSSSSSLLV